MAKVKQKKLTVDLAPGVDFWDWYQRNAATDVAGWLAGMDAGDTSDLFATTEEPEVLIPAIEGTFDFAVIQKDAAGNESDPTTFVSWTAVPLDLSPPDRATGGAIISV